VPLSSSGIDSEFEIPITLDADHLNICKFGGRSDVGYKHVHFAVQGYQKNAGKRGLSGDSNQSV
jgi:hypothetical protein